MCRDSAAKVVVIFLSRGYSTQHSIAAVARRVDGTHLVNLEVDLVYPRVAVERGRPEHNEIAQHR